MLTVPAFSHLTKLSKSRTSPQSARTASGRRTWTPWCGQGHSHGNLDLPWREKSRRQGWRLAEPGQRMETAECIISSEVGAGIAETGSRQENALNPS